MATRVIAVYEHADFYVFDKPAGASFHNEDGNGFFAQLQAQHPQETLYPAHRLDKMTSGLLLAARSKAAAQQLGELFATRAVQKTYLALSDHKPSKKQGTISGDMQRTRDGSWKLLRTQEYPAITCFSSQSLAPGLRLFVLQPRTGRTHQLRVMMKALGSPILGDTRYGGTTADRGYLHAARLAFDWHGQRVDIHCLPTQGELFTGLASIILVRDEFRDADA